MTYSRPCNMVDQAKSNHKLYLWVLRLELVEKPLLQTVQMWGFSPVCVLMWRLSRLGRSKVLPQTAQGSRVFSRGRLPGPERGWFWRAWPGCWRLGCGGWSRLGEAGKKGADKDGVGLKIPFGIWDADARRPDCRKNIGELNKQFLRCCFLYRHNFHGRPLPFNPSYICTY